MTNGGGTNHSNQFQGVMHKTGLGDNTYNNNNNNISNNSNNVNQPNTGLFQHYNNISATNSTPSFTNSPSTSIVISSNGQPEYLSQQSQPLSQSQSHNQPAITSQNYYRQNELLMQQNSNLYHTQQFITHANSDEYDYFSQEASLSVPSSKIDYPYYQDGNTNNNDNTNNNGNGFDNSQLLQHRQQYSNVVEPEFHLQQPIQMLHQQQQQQISSPQIPPDHIIYPQHQFQQHNSILNLGGQHQQIQEGNVKRKLSSSQLAQLPSHIPNKTKAFKPPTIRQNSMPNYSSGITRPITNSTTQASSNLNPDIPVDLLTNDEMWEKYLSGIEIPKMNNESKTKESSGIPISQSSSTNKVSTVKNPRPRTRKTKIKPSFTLKLDSLRNDNMFKSQQVTSSQSDSGVYNFDNLPTFNISNPIFTGFNDTSLDNKEDLKFGEKDLDEIQIFGSSQPLVTPSMMPPGGNSYFELNPLNHSDDNKLNSPQIIYNDNSFDGINKSFNQYIETPKAKDLNSITKGNVGEGHFVNQSINDESKNIISSSLIGPSLTLSSSIDSSSINKINHNSNNIVEYNNSKIDKSSEEESSGSESEDENIYLVPEEGLERSTMDRTNSGQSVSSSGSTSSSKDNIESNDKSEKKDKPKKKKTPKSAICPVCNKFISRDLIRHMRIHNAVGRFQCVYPKHMCKHKTQYFNRPYDYKKHLLHIHFKFDDPKGKTSNTLTDKLPLQGTCMACGIRQTASDWLDNHVLTSQPQGRCPFVESKEAR
ncbi:uncharacterized protein RJT21DRAFT_121010 [Scheffersomyces amazonensis]|uniref:uncharacterized protein n=1 Tax=Scheffersomyces amazonensis TaxID=1078765 RepID=UPI00315D2838